MTDSFLCPVCQHREHIYTRCFWCSCQYDKTMAAAMERLRRAWLDLGKVLLEEWRKLWRK